MYLLAQILEGEGGAGKGGLTSGKDVEVSCVSFAQRLDLELHLNKNMRVAEYIYRYSFINIKQ